jgi:diaminopimelate epimerase
MTVHFYKYQGAGNDFIIIEGRYGLPLLSQKEIHFLCNRRFGIGADGLMVIGYASDADFSMYYYNADGKEGTMCGNGGRCLVAYAAHHNDTKDWIFSAVDGIHRAEILEHKGAAFQVKLWMNDVNTIDPYGKDGFYLNTGSPHLVIFDPNVSQLDVSERGAFWRNHPDFAPEGTNVNFVNIEQEGTLFVRTYERGVEAETFACGTGVTAAALAAYLRSGVDSYSIRTPGGDLKVSFKVIENRFYDVQLTGPATFVFEGDVTI